MNYIPFCVLTGAPDCRIPPTTKGLATVDILQYFFLFQSIL